MLGFAVFVWERFSDCPENEIHHVINDVCHASRRLLRGEYRGGRKRRKRGGNRNKMAAAAEVATQEEGELLFSPEILEIYSEAKEDGDQHSQGKEVDLSSQGKVIEIDSQGKVMVLNSLGKIVQLDSQGKIVGKGSEETGSEYVEPDEGCS